MCAPGSLPECPGAPPEIRIHRVILRGSYPWTASRPPVTPFMYGAPRASIQMSEFMRCRPEPSTATVPSHCAVQHTPITRAGATSLSAIIRRLAVVIARHQSSGSCSTPPSSVRISRVGAYPLATTAPLVATSATFGPEVPRSIARTHSSVVTGSLKPSPLSSLRLGPTTLPPANRSRARELPVGAVPARSRRPQRGLERAGEARRGLLGHLLVARLHHHPHDRLGARRPHEHAPAVAELGFDAAHLGPEARGPVEPLALAHPHVAQHLRVLRDDARELRQRLTGAHHHVEQQDADERAVAGDRVVTED